MYVSSQPATNTAPPGARPRRTGCWGRSLPACSNDVTCPPGSSRARKRSNCPWLTKVGNAPLVPPAPAPAAPPPAAPAAPAPPAPASVEAPPPAPAAPVASSPAAPASRQGAPASARPVVPAAPPASAVCAGPSEPSVPALGPPLPHPRPPIARAERATTTELGLPLGPRMAYAMREPTERFPADCQLRTQDWNLPDRAPVHRGKTLFRAASHCSASRAQKR